jgi:hypothetical protein
MPIEDQVMTQLPSFFTRSAREVLKETNEQLSKVLSSKSVKTTQMIRKGSFVYGEVMPVEKYGTSDSK